MLLISILGHCQSEARIFLRYLSLVCCIRRLDLIYLIFLLCNFIHTITRKKLVKFLLLFIFYIYLLFCNNFISQCSMFTNILANNDIREHISINLAYLQDMSKFRGVVSRRPSLFRVVTLGSNRRQLFRDQEQVRPLFLIVDHSHISSFVIKTKLCVTPLRLQLFLALLGFIFYLTCTKKVGSMSRPLHE